MIFIVLQCSDDIMPCVDLYYDPFVVLFVCQPCPATCHIRYFLYLLLQMAFYIAFDIEPKFSQVYR